MALMAMRTTSATGNNAFTLIELSIVVFIIAMVMAISAPAFLRSYNSALLGETARTFATICQLARLQAVTRQGNAVLHVDVDRQAFWLTQMTKTDDTLVRDMTIKTHRLSPRVTLVSVELVDGRAKVEKYVEAQFYPNGTCDALSLVLRGTEGNALVANLDPITCKATAAMVK
jgi:prepilin-type N-terminal cleavage/methylation domain-containing protein